MNKNEYKLLKTIMIDWLIIYGFTSHSRILHLYGNVTIADEGLQNLDLCSALRAFEQGGIPAVTRDLGFFSVSSEGSPHLVASYLTWILTRFKNNI